jgi:muconolactone D-isomerase
MLFLLDIDIDYGKLGDSLGRVLEEEGKRSRELYESGIMLRIWRKANARGAVAVWDVPDAETLRENLVKMPLYPYFSDVRLMPLVPHPLFPEFAE